MTSAEREKGPVFHTTNLPLITFGGRSLRNGYKSNRMVALAPLQRQSGLLKAVWLQLSKLTLISFLMMSR